jgi:hypothetical protein
MDTRALLIYLESPYASFNEQVVPAREVVLAGLNWPTPYWPGLAIDWLEQGAAIDAQIAQALDELAAKKAFPQGLKHKAFALARRWERTNNAG